MFDENKFKEEYKCAYDAIVPDMVIQIKNSKENKNVRCSMTFMVVVAAFVICCLVFVVSTQAMAGVRN